MTTDIVMRAPTPADGTAVHRLIAACPPLDTNSVYCNLLQCSHFANTSVLAEREGELLGFISGYRIPDDSSRLFIWQVAVSPLARGEGVGLAMLDALLTRVGAGGLTWLETTITEANQASWALFQKLARSRNLALSRSVQFDRSEHFLGQHDTEFRVLIGPFE